MRLIRPLPLPPSSASSHPASSSQSTPSIDATAPHQGDTLALWFPEAGQPPRVFDFVSTSPRPGGLKLHLHRDRPLQGITTLNLVYDASLRNILAEALAYQLYHLAGYPAPKTTFTRLFDNLRPVGFHLAIEQPNKSFLRRIGKPDNGSLYKSTETSASLNHTPDTAATSHEKKSYPHLGHHDLVQLLQKLQHASRIELWDFLCREFDADLVVTFFALNSLLSHWDGFADGYFLYLENEESNRWTFFPWDLDNTFGFYPGLATNQVFADMPLLYGAHLPPPSPTPSWHRLPGPFSGPFLSNPHFQHHFHARIRDLLASLFAEDVLFPILENFRTQLTPAVQERAQLNASSPDLAVQQLNAAIQSIQTNIVQRRHWLLQQPEIQRAAAYDRTALKRNR